MRRVGIVGQHHKRHGVRERVAVSADLQCRLRPGERGVASLYDLIGTFASLQDEGLDDVGVVGIEHRSREIDVTTVHDDTITLQSLSGKFVTGKRNVLADDGFT